MCRLVMNVSCFEIVDWVALFSYEVLCFLFRHSGFDQTVGISERIACMRQARKGECFVDEAV